MAGYLSQIFLRALEFQVDILLSHHCTLMVHSPEALGNPSVNSPFSGTTNLLPVPLGA